MSKKDWLLVGLAAAVGMMVFGGCEQEAVVRPDRNRAPETALSVAPELGGRAFHKYRVRWTGYDRDGAVIGFRIATVSEDGLYGGLKNPGPEDVIQYLLGLSWTVTDATESVFVFQADRPNTRSHSLYVEAIDNEGKVDPTPAMTNFLAIDYGVPQDTVYIRSNSDSSSLVARRVALPEVAALPAFNLINPAQPESIWFTWGGQDPDGTIQEWRYRVDSGMESAVPAETREAVYVYDPNNRAGSSVWRGFHEFKLVGIDDAGAKSNEDVTRFVINYDPDTFIDEVSVFRYSHNGKYLEQRIYPSDTPAAPQRIAYQYGRLRFKFHGIDRDGFVPDTLGFRWNIKGSLIQSGDALEPWVGKQCAGGGGFFCDQTIDADSGGVALDTDAPLTLFIRSRDNYGKVDGTPDTIMFIVDYPPVIGSVSAGLQATPGTVRFTWSCEDPDEDTGRGAGGDKALISYRYRIDQGVYTQTTERNLDGTFRKQIDISGISPGEHTFSLWAYNSLDFIDTRSDKKEIGFSVPAYGGGGGR
jgi:hypothetical protein